MHRINVSSNVFPSFVISICMRNAHADMPAHYSEASVRKLVSQSHRCFAANNRNHEADVPLFCRLETTDWHHTSNVLIKVGNVFCSITVSLSTGGG